MQPSLMLLLCNGSRHAVDADRPLAASFCRRRAPRAPQPPDGASWNRGRPAFLFASTRAPG
jgi:hypothetical protein